MTCTRRATIANRLSSASANLQPAHGQAPVINRDAEVLAVGLPLLLPCLCGSRQFVRTPGKALLELVELSRTCHLAGETMRCIAALAWAAPLHH